MKIIASLCKWTASGLLLLLLVLLIHVQIVSYSVAFYQREFAKLNRPEALGTSISELARFSRQTTRYLAGLEQTANVSLLLFGQERWLLNQRELQHMQDVQQLFTWARVATAAGLLLLLGSGLLAFRRRQLARFLRWLALSAGLALLGGLVAGYLISLDFTQAFDSFHLLAFSNDLWQLDPATDQLINLLPEQFFADAALLATKRAAVTLLLLLATAGFGKFRLDCSELS